MIVWLASYPRSGNTFFRVLLNSVFDIKTHSLYGDVNDIAADEKTANVVGHEMLPEDYDVEALRNSDEVYYIKTHGKPDVVDGNDRVIYLVRDGRESSLSYMNYLNDYGGKATTLDEVILGAVSFGSWGDHVSAWSAWSAVSNESSLLVQFEELVSNPEKYVEKISSFLGVEVVGSLPPDFSELQKVNPRFFRSGKTRSWESAYSKEQVLYFGCKYNKQLEEFGYDSSYSSSKFDKDVCGLVSYFDNIFAEMAVSSSYLKAENKDFSERIRVLRRERDRLMGG